MGEASQCKTMEGMLSVLPACPPCLIDVHQLEEVHHNTEHMTEEEGEHNAEEDEDKVPLLLHLLPRPKPKKIYEKNRIIFGPWDCILNHISILGKQILITFFKIYFAFCILEAFFLKQELS